MSQRHKNVPIILLILITIPLCSTIWPPPYKIHLNHSEEFVIFETFGDPDNIYSDEEMIKSEDLKSFNLDKDYDKYLKIHKYAMDLGRKQSKNFTNPINITRIKWKESNFDNEDNVPYIAGIFESENSNVLDTNAKVFYYNEMAKSVVDREVMKRNEMVTKKDEKMIVQKKYIIENETDYDYKSFKNAYDGEIVKFKTDNETLKFENVKEEESVNDAVEKIIDFEEPLNCTEEEVKGIGLKAIKCLAYDLKNVRNSDNRDFLIKRVKKIVFIWFCVYLVIAIPLWCEKGWCCCCFCCRCCNPQKRIDQVKKFLADNPPGVLKTPKGVIRKFTPTPYEKYTQKKLEQAIMKL